MKHPDGLRVQLRHEEDAYIEEYHGDQIVNPLSQADYTGTCIVEEPGAEFLSKIWFTDFELHGAEGVGVIVGCGHGSTSPDDFEHIQCYWINKNKINTNHYLVLQGVTIQDKTGFQVDEGSVAVQIQRGYFENSHRSLRKDPSAQGGTNRASRARLVADPPDTRASKPSKKSRESQTLRHGLGDNPIIIARHWFRALEGEHGRPYLFEFKNLGPVDMVEAGLELRDDSGALDPDPKDESDCSELESDDEGSDDEYDPNLRPRSASVNPAQRLNRGSADQDQGAQTRGTPKATM
ncbi:hypothetical protein LTR97_004070 [Elasticomyces elasticus]|uniref:Uncharacterized protein n=1 Tax=Elasticomyces elasticus TaxID=574655 RepID=A0AAN7W9R6_9PEZI|nr:hypothetical protein LTR97_004070 [Elasticomyces elasticus]